MVRVHHFDFISSHRWYDDLSQMSEFSFHKKVNSLYGGKDAKYEGLYAIGTSLREKDS